MSTATKPLGRKTADEIERITREINKLNPLQGSVEEQNRILLYKMERRAKDRLRKQEKRAKPVEVSYDTLFSKTGMSQAILAQLAIDFPEVSDRKYDHKFLRIVHTIIEMQQKRQIMGNEYVEIRSGILEASSTHTKKFKYTEVVAWLIKSGFIATDNTYWEGKKARYYVLNAPWQEADLETIRVSVHNSKRRKNNEEFLVKKRRLDAAGIDPVVTDKTVDEIIWLNKNLNRLRIDQARAFAWIDEQCRIGAPLKNVRVKKVIRIKGGEYKEVSLLKKGRMFSEKTAKLYKELVISLNAKQETKNLSGKLCITNGRFDSELTSLPTGLRSFITVVDNSATILNFDLAASQVFLAVSRLKRTKVAIANPGGFDEIDRLIATGQFYIEIKKRIQAFYTGKPFTGDPKQRFFQDILFSKSHHETKFRKAFNTMFPVFHEALMELAGDGKEVLDKETSELRVVYPNLPIEFQREESRLFLSTILPKLYEALCQDAFVATIHDSVLCTAENADFVEQTIRQVLTEATGVKPTLHREEVTPQALLGIESPEPAPAMLVVTSEPEPEIWSPTVTDNEVSRRLLFHGPYGTGWEIEEAIEIDEYGDEIVFQEKRELTEADWWRKAQAA